LAVPSALRASPIAPAQKLSTRFGGARSTNCRSTSAIASSSRENSTTASASRALKLATDCDVRPSPVRR